MRLPKLPVFVAASALSIFAIGCLPRRGGQIDVLDVSNPTFKMRIRKFAEKAFPPTLLGHHYFVFETTASGSDDWREILAWRTDPVSYIERGFAHVVTDRVVYAHVN